MEYYETIEEQIEEELDDNMTYRKLHTYVDVHDVESDTTVEIPYGSFTNQYRAYLKDIVSEIELDEDEYQQYRHNPQVLSYNLYGVTHYWAMLLELNHCKSRIDFDSRTVKVYDPLKLEDILSEILTKEGVLT